MQDQILTEMVRKKTFLVIIRPNARQNKVIGFNEMKRAYNIQIKGPPKDNRANTELVKFLSNLLKKDVVIVRGLRSKEKLIRIT